MDWQLFSSLFNLYHSTRTQFTLLNQISSSSRLHAVVLLPILTCASEKLSSYATKIKASRKLLAKTALSVTLKATRSTSTLMNKLSKIHGPKPREAAAMRDCVEELSDSVDEIQRSIDEIEYSGGKDFDLRMGDVKTWVSAALTNEDTCMDGFTGNVMATVRTHIVNVARMTSNVLALVNSYAAKSNQNLSP